MKKYLESNSVKVKNSAHVYEAGKEYFQYLKDLKNDTENNEYSVSFMMF